MRILYHGTGLETIFAIAESGAILSPLEQEIKALKSFYKDPEEFEKDFGKTIEEFALLLVTLDYKRELFRAKTVSIERRLTHAVNYTKGGAILGIEFDDVLPKESNAVEGTVIFIPKKVDITRLKEIHISPQAKHAEKRIRDAYAKYNPTYFYLL